MAATLFFYFLLLVVPVAVFFACGCSFWSILFCGMLLALAAREASRTWRFLQDQLEARPREPEPGELLFDLVATLGALVAVLVIAWTMKSW